MQIHKSMLVVVIGLALCKLTSPTNINIKNQKFELNELTNITINLQTTNNYEIYGKIKIDIKQVLEKLGRPAALEYLQSLSAHDLERQFYKSILKDDYELVELFIAAGIDVNKEIDGCCPLAIAIKKNKPNACKALLDANAEFNKRTALYYPLDNGFIQIVAHLKRKGAKSYLNQKVFAEVLLEEAHKRIGKFNRRLRNP